jgi:hypothetical protein
MYGLKEARKLSDLRLVSLLSSFGFYEAFIPCLFKHVSRSILFVLVVDNFGVKYSLRSDFDFAPTLTFFSLVSLPYTPRKPTPSSPSFLASLSPTTAPPEPSPSLTPANYASHLLARLRPLGVPPPAIPPPSTLLPSSVPGLPSPPLSLTSPPQGATGAGRIPAVLRQMRRRQDPPRHLRPHIRAGLLHPLHHGPPPTSDRIRGSTS